MLRSASFCSGFDEGISDNPLDPVPLEISELMSLLPPPPSPNNQRWSVSRAGERGSTVSGVTPSLFPDDMMRCLQALRKILQPTESDHTARHFKPLKKISPSNFSTDVVIQNHIQAVIDHLYVVREAPNTLPPGIPFRIQAKPHLRHALCEEIGKLIGNVIRDDYANQLPVNVDAITAQLITKIEEKKAYLEQDTVCLITIITSALCGSAIPQNQEDLKQYLHRALVKELGDFTKSQHATEFQRRCDFLIQQETAYVISEIQGKGLYNRSNRRTVNQLFHHFLKNIKQILPEQLEKELVAQGLLFVEQLGRRDPLRTMPEAMGKHFVAAAELFTRYKTVSVDLPAVEQLFIKGLEEALLKHWATQTKQYIERNLLSFMNMSPEQITRAATDYVDTHGAPYRIVQNESAEEWTQREQRERQHFINTLQADINALCNYNTVPRTVPKSLWADLDVGSF